MVRIGAGGCGVPVRRPMQAFWLCIRPRYYTRDCNGKEGVAGSSPAEGFQIRSAARFSCFRSGSADPFRTLPSEKGSSMGAGRRCAAVGWTAERLPLSAKVPTRYTPGARCWCDRPAKGRRSVRRRSARSGSTSRRSGSRVVRDGRILAVGSSGPEQWRRRPRGFSQQAESKKHRLSKSGIFRRASRAGPLRPWTRWRDAARYCIRSDSAAARGRARRGVVTDGRGGIAVGDCRTQACPTPGCGDCRRGRRMEPNVHWAGYRDRCSRAMRSATCRSSRSSPLRRARPVSSLTRSRRR
jgi:hypothetical protein